MLARPIPAFLDAIGRIHLPAASVARNLERARPVQTTNYESETLSALELAAGDTLEGEMANGFDGEGGGGNFVIGLLAGTVLGAGLGMLFAPKPGSELRSRLSDQAGTLRDRASAGLHKVGDAASEWKEHGRHVAGAAREAARAARSAAREAHRDVPAMSGVNGAERSSAGTTAD